MGLFDFENAFFNTEKAEKKGDLKNEMTSRSHKAKTKIRFESKLKREKVAEILTELPQNDESIHIVSNGNFDYFTIITRILDLRHNKTVKNFYFSTWTMSHQNVIDILELYDKKIFANVNALTGEYFRTRESAVYHILDLGLKERGQRLFANKNHAKVTLLEIENDFYVIEGSANFTANPRIEQFSITNNKGLFFFHKKWQDELLDKSANNE